MTHRTSKVVVTIRRPFLALLTTIALLATGLVAQSIPAAAAVSSLDGSNAADAAASCWEVKQTHPTSTDGIYWLYTSVMDAPEQFYCDMTTDGGGWVLIGRGREGWRMEYEGLRDPVRVRSTVTGPAAFTAAQLSSSTVDALIGGQDVDELQDGIRLRRATNTAGTTWQEARFNFASRDRWVWTFGARHVTKNVSFDGVAAGNGQTSSFGSDNSFRRVTTTSTAAQNWTRGFAFGGSVSGSPASDSYLWSSSAGVGAARPFTQMYLRPRLTSASFDAIPDAGTPAIEQAPLAETKAVPTVWGVSGLATSASELRTEVQSFAQIGDYMYVGGNFANVQRSANDTSPVAQPFLAAFNVNTGQWLSSFRPTLDSQVKALEALPNGQLAVGGEFTQVNGSPASGLVALNPTTGARSSSWTAEVENRLTGGVVSVRSLKSSEDWLYVGGNFTHLGGGSAPGTVYSRGAGRLAAGNGTPDGSWNPNFNGTVTEVEPSTDGSRVYAAGYFTVSNGVPTEKGAALQTSPGAAPIPWTVRHSAVANYQQTVLEAEDRVWLGGSEHSFFSYTTSDLSVASGNITMAGGDFQTSTTGAGVVYGGCHCDDFNYSGSYTWPDPGTGWTQA
ncbi:MAG: hypothetical protein H0U62_11350, partial [Actinobacteria bacterium]|nr:hypothetical protein [Actinomycetota bacterium]